MSTTQFCECAKRTKEYWENKLYKEYPNIVGVSSEIDVNENGNSIGVIVVTIKDESHKIPDKLLDVETGLYVPVRIEIDEEAIAC